MLILHLSNYLKKSLFYTEIISLEGNKRKDQPKM